MSCKLKLLVVAGARPNFMKVAPVLAAINRHNASRGPRQCELEYRLVHTGQHYDEKMSQIFFTELGIPAPDVNLEVGSGTHAVQTANVMREFEPVCKEAKPDWVVVVGDVNSTLACALVCAKMGVRVAHVEAGLRSFDRSMPEEINRIVTDAISDLLLTPSEDADENLRREGVPEAKIRRVGNVMIDSLVSHLSKAQERGTLARLGVEALNYVYVTLHRPANVDDERPLRHIASALRAISDQVPVIFPIHPRTRECASRFGIDFAAGERLKVIEPIGYLDSLCLTEHARCVVTDSGGLQEESTFFRTPCLTLRPNTERPVTVSLGSNRLSAPDRLTYDLKTILAGERRHGVVPPLWDGRAAERIVSELMAFGTNP
jgi:UDP-N-acetylglucosamine 2-epimerase (non-hydrolysing)